MAVTLPLVTLDQAITQTGLTAEEHQPMLLVKIDAATAVVLDYLHDYIADHEPTWTTNTDPSSDFSFALAHAAILEVLTYLVFHRGDDAKPSDGPLTPSAVNILRGLKVPALG